MKNINLTIAFILELVLFSSLFYGNLRILGGGARAILFSVISAALVAVLWGMFAAPRSAHRLHQPHRTAFTLALFGVAALLLWLDGYPAGAFVLGSVAVLNQSLVLAWRQ